MFQIEAQVMSDAAGQWQSRYVDIYQQFALVVCQTTGYIDKR